MDNVLFRLTITASNIVEGAFGAVGDVSKSRRRRSRPSFDFVVLHHKRLCSHQRTKNNIMPTPAKTPEGGKKRELPSPKSASPEKKASLPVKKKGRPTLPPSAKLSTKHPRVGRPKKEVLVYDPKLPPPPPPPPPVNNPFYQKFVMEYWQNNNFVYQRSGAVMTNIAGFGSPMLFPTSPWIPAASANSNLEGKPVAAVEGKSAAAAAAAKSDAVDDKVESTSV